jgi:acetyl esterase/lipase
MRRFYAWLWSGASALAGVLSVWPSIPAFPRRGLALAQVVATEDPGLALCAGLVGIWKGWRAREPRAVLLGMVGVALRLRPLVRRGKVSRAMADAMREGLGLGWQRGIPPEVHRAFAQQHRMEMAAPIRHPEWLRTRETRDVLFAAPDGCPLRMDIYQPAHAPESCPAVIVVHGGTWFQGDKSTYALGLHDRWLAGQGYVVFDIQYRLGVRWPAPLADVKCAIRWVRANASRYGVDPARIAILGRAAGAHLALMAAYTANDPAYPPACFTDSGATHLDESVQAVIVSAAPTDLRLWAAEPGSAVEQLLGGLPDDAPDAYAQASPITHVRPGLPPTLIIHGQRDRTISPNQAELLANHLRAAKVTTVLLRIPWGRHGIDCWPLGLTGPMVQYDVDRFLAWAFHRQGAASQG